MASVLIGSALRIRRLQSSTFREKNVITHRLIKNTLIKVLQITLTLAMTLFLAYCMMNWGPFDWILQTKAGRDAHSWLLSSIRWYGCESSLDSLVTLAFFSMLPPSIWICVSLSRYLATLNLNNSR
jgi:hypothetical protein